MHLDPQNSNAHAIQMRIHIIVTALLTSLVGWPATGADFETVKTLLREKMPGVEIGKVRPAPIAGLLEVVVNRKRVDEQMLTGKDLPQDAAKCETPLASLETLVRSLGTEGIPGLVLGNGKLVEGAIPRQQIAALLNVQ